MIHRYCMCVLSTHISIARPSDFVDVNAIDSSAQPSRLYRRVAELLAQCRNRIFKHLLGSDYRLSADAPNAAPIAQNTVAKVPLMMLPQELSLSILQFLPSRGTSTSAIDCQPAMKGVQASVPFVAHLCLFIVYACVTC
jgi:hypothetical protein